MKGNSCQIDLPPIDRAANVDWFKVGVIPIDVSDGSLIQVCSSNPWINVIASYAELGIPGAIRECYVRQGVYCRLLNVARALPSEYKLVVMDAWRPTCVQQYLFDSLRESIRAKHSGIAESELLQLALDFVALPSSDAQSPSFHLTGGAVDVTLSYADGQLLDMGSAFDAVTPVAHTAFFEGRELFSPSERRARDNRRCLYWAMIEQGFTNLFSEWWHYDFGDQLWAYCSGNKRALYGPATPKWASG